MSAGEVSSLWFWASQLSFQGTLSPCVKVGFKVENERPSEKYSLVVQAAAHNPLARR